MMLNPIPIFLSVYFLAKEIFMELLGVILKPCKASLEDAA